MDKRVLGKTTIEVSEISFGTVSLGLPYGIGATSESDMPSETDSIELLNEALDNGINFFDTALAYGKSEEVIGKAFKGCREKAIICTKPAHLYDVYANQELPSRLEILKKLDDSIQQSLSKLKTDYIDIYMSHDGAEEVIENETIVDFYQNLKKKGIIRASGVSVYTVEESIKAINSGVWDVIQLAFNLMDQTQLPAIELACQKGVGVVVRSVLFKGILTGKGDNLLPQLKLVQNHRQKYDSLLNDDVKTLSDLATKFVLSCKGVSSVLVGIDKPEYLSQALAVADGKYLDVEILEKAKQLAYPDPEFLNLPMWDRKGWLK
jgi:aryl-alcohol dehydrogenase-like predicted oxidoreductase